MPGKNLPVAAQGTGGVDAIGSYTLKQSSHTQRDKNVLDDIEEPNPNAAKMAATIDNKGVFNHLEVTDRLYNKKQIQKAARMKSSNVKQQSR